MKAWALRTDITREARERFLQILSESGNVSRACGLSGLSRSRIYEWRDRDPDFAAEWTAALQLGACALEDEAMKRAMDGSDYLLVFMLRALMPDKYRERRTVDVKSNITLDLKRLPREELVRRLEALRLEQSAATAPPLKLIASTGADRDGG